MRDVFTRARELLGRSRIRAEMDEEFRFHLDMQTEQNLRRGMSPDDARRAAMIAFGARERIRDETSDARGFMVLENLARDTRHSLRRLRRSPGFTMGVMVTLGIGLGAAVGIGAVVHGVLLQDLPYERADALVRVSLNTPGIAGSSDLHSDATYLHLAGSSRSFEAFAAYYTNDGITLTQGDGAERVNAAMVTPGVFALLGARPHLGQLFAPSDTAWERSSPILISQELWERKFGSDPAIIGRTLRLNFGERQVVGVLPRAFDFPSPAIQIWYPARVSLDNPSLTSRYFNVIARRRPGVPLDVASRELNGTLASLPTRFPSITTEALRTASASVGVQTLKGWMIAPVRGQLVLLGAMVLVVIVVATTNVINLFLLRAERASHESAIALSLGATRGAIVRRFLVEGIVLGLGSLILSVPIAAALVESKLGFSAGEIPRLHEVGFTALTLAALVTAAMVVGAIVGLTTLIQNATITGDRLIQGGRRTTASRAWRRTQRALVATQVALALSLVITAGLLGRSFMNLRNAELGFDPQNTTTFEVVLPFRGYTRYAHAAAFHGRVTDGLKALPGVSDAVAVTQLPLAASGAPEVPLLFEAIGSPAATPLQARALLATPDYFGGMGIRLRSGRSFAAGDLRGEPGVVLSERVARDLFGTEDPVGRRIRRVDAAPADVFQVIGVAGDTPGARLEEGAASNVYFPLLPDADGLPVDTLTVPLIPRGIRYVARSTRPISAAEIRSVLSAVDPRVPAMAIQSMDRLVDVASARARLTLVLLALSSAAALVLGMVGVYSVVSYAAAEREREFGVRLALGATPRGVTTLVFREGAVMAAMGIGSGLAVAWASARLLGALLYEVDPFSALEVVAGVVVIGALSMVATLLPARRAARTDPALVMRAE